MTIRKERFDPNRECLRHFEQRLRPTSRVEESNHERRCLHGLPPIRSASEASPQSVIETPNESDFTFRWSSDGHSVALVHRGEPMALVSEREKRGYSKAVAATSALANPWNNSVFAKLIG